MLLPIHTFFSTSLEWHHASYSDKECPVSENCVVCFCGLLFLGVGVGVCRYKCGCGCIILCVCGLVCVCVCLGGSYTGGVILL